MSYTVLRVQHIMIFINVLEVRSSSMEEKSMSQYDMSKHCASITDSNEKARGKGS